MGSWVLSTEYPLLTTKLLGQISKEKMPRKKEQFEITIKLNKFVLIGIVVLIIAGVVFSLYYISGQPGISYGDAVNVSYEMFFAKNGSIIGQELTVNFKVGENKVFPAFEKNILGMKIGQKKRFTLKAEEAFGKYDLTNIEKIPRYKTIDRETWMPLGEVRKTIGSQYKLQENETVRLSEYPWPVLLKKISADNVTIVHMPRLNSLYTDPYLLVWPIKVVNLTNETVTWEQMPKIGSVAYNGRVMEITEDSVIVDFNHPLAGNDIIFDAKILDVTKPS